MKAFLFLLVILITSASPVNSDTKRFYYFCVSRSLDTANATSKQVILLTEVKEINTEELNFKALAKAWGQQVDKQCKSSNGCTSDLNYYFDKETAQTQFEKDQKRYSDSSRFILQKVAF